MAAEAPSSFSALDTATGTAATTPVFEPTGTIGGSIPISLHYLAGEVASAAAVLGTLTQIIKDNLQYFALLLAIVWYMIAIYESKPFRKLFKLKPAPGCIETKEPPDVLK